MKAVSGKDLCRILAERGWVLRRITGSHHVFTRAGSNLRISVPVHRNKSLKTGLQRAIMKMAELSDSDLQ
jgi:predicted RNA binding protein YcfA (HicA-like mRNA interferase family)